MGDSESLKAIRQMVESKESTVHSAAELELLHQYVDLIVAAVPPSADSVTALDDFAPKLVDLNDNAAGELLSVIQQMCQNGGLFF